MDYFIFSICQKIHFNLILHTKNFNGQYGQEDQLQW